MIMVFSTSVKIMYILPFLCVFINISLAGALQCMNENNDPVDWFTVYKVPKIKHTNPLIASGVGYLFLTSQNYTWTLSNFGIDDPESIIGKTVDPLFSQKNVSHLLYNDQPPNEPSKPEKGHTKGAILTDLTSALWLVHSVPHFLEPSEYKYPETGIRNGQSFLCISLDLKNLNKIGVQLQYNEPQIYASYIEKTLDTKLSQIVAAATGTVVQKAPWYNEVTVTSKGGVQFRSFAKSGRFGKDLYHDWVAPTLGSDLLTETWLNGPGRLPSNCSNSNFRVYNVETLSLIDGNISFTASEDHSKWAVGVQSPWTCVGDINRMEHQELRGGGTVCQRHPTLAERYRKSVQSIEQCHKNSNYYH